jgi:alpha-L-arabinofuranosidase
MITIQGPDPKTDNNFDSPRLISPRDSRLENVGTSFSVELPPYSVNLLRIKTNQ